jgi:hypothetical protein
MTTKMVTTGRRLGEVMCLYPRCKHYIQPGCCGLAWCSHPDNRLANGDGVRVTGTGWCNRHEPDPWWLEVLRRGGYRWPKEPENGGESECPPL